MEPAPQDGSPLVLTSPRPAVWVRVMGCVALVVIVAMWVSTLADPAPPTYLPLFAPTVLGAVMLITWLRPPRIELHRTCLVVVPLVRTRRVPYADIAAVRGDAGRLEWSTRLHLELTSGKQLLLPRVETTLPETRELITRHADLTAAAPTDPAKNPSDEG